MHIILTFLFLALATLGLSQTIQSGSTTVFQERLSYSFMEPDSNVTGALILLPGLGERPESIFKKTNLPRLLIQHGIATIVPHPRQTLIADSHAIAQVNELYRILSDRYRSDTLDLFIGGLSAGGTIAIGYAEYIFEKNIASNLKAVFAIDPPLDMQRIYQSAENKLRYNCKSKLIRKEGIFLRNYLRSIMQGTPVEKPETYVKLSAFSGHERDGGNARYLKSIPIRLYCEPDLDFVRNKYCSELRYEDINAFDLEHLHRFLLQLGNNQAEYITTRGKGFHSWNIVDAADCVKWMTSIENH